MSHLSKLNKLRIQAHTLGESIRTKSDASGVTCSPEDFTPELPASLRRDFVDGWMGKSWKTRIYGTNAVRVWIGVDRLVVRGVVL
jgi:hypothetical protein